MFDEEYRCPPGRLSDRRSRLSLAIAGSRAESSDDRLLKLADAVTPAALQGRKAAQLAAAWSLKESRACLAFRRGLAIDIDEAKPPLVCIRLTGDLSCYSVSVTLIDEHPGVKGGCDGKRGSGGRRGR